jgi:hypothetical protein
MEPADQPGGSDLPRLFHPAITEDFKAHPLMAGLGVRRGQDWPPHPEALSLLCSA